MITGLIVRIEALGRESQAGDPWEHAKAYIALDERVDAALTALKTPLLRFSRAWGDEERDSVMEIREAAERLALLGAGIARRCERDNVADQHDELLQKVIIIALANHATAAKWHATTRGNPHERQFASVHALYRMAERLEIARAPMALVREGVSRRLTPEAHYLRTLLLPLACTGELDGQQLEIVDSWLWTWVRDYRLTREPEAGEAGLWVDVKSDEGVRLGQFAPSGIDVRFLVVSRLREQLDEVIDGFHSGHIYPGFGLSSELRLEAHVALLDRIESTWQRLSHLPVPRDGARTGVERPRVEALVGINEILGRGFVRQAEIAAPGMSNVHEIAHHWARVQEDGESGIRLAVDHALWQSLSQGELVGLRIPGAPALAVGMVARKFLKTGDSSPRIEAEWIVRDARRVLLRESGDVAGTPQVLAAIYAAGDDNCGRFDTLIVPEAAFTRNATYDVVFPDRTFTIRLNRVRHKGRGWVAAGIEVTQACDREPPPSARQAPRADWPWQGARSAA